MKSKYPFTLIAVMFVFCMTTIISSVVDARGRGGGGGFSRGGPAAGGGFSSRPAARQPARQAPRQETRRIQPDDHDRDRGDRQDYRDDAREDRQDYRDDAREDRQDYLDDEWDDHHHDYHGGAAFVTGVAVGAAASSNYVTSAPCNTTVVVSGLTYYHCGSTWYSRGNEGGEVVYIIVSPPAGY